MSPVWYLGPVPHGAFLEVGKDTDPMRALITRLRSDKQREKVLLDDWPDPGKRYPVVRRQDLRRKDLTQRRKGRKAGSLRRLCAFA